MNAAWPGVASVAICEAPQKPNAATDEQINYAVDYELLTDAALTKCQIFAKTSDGIVTLAGTAM